MMRWKKESFEDKKIRMRERLKAQWMSECEWHRKFAWLPVEIADDEMAWLCWVERRLSGWDSEKQPEFYVWFARRFEYRLP